MIRIIGSRRAMPQTERLDHPTHSPMTARSQPQPFSVAAALALTLLLPAAHAEGPGDDTTPRQQDVARRGASVMPFDLEATTHVFTSTPTGGTQRVVAKPSTDAGVPEQVALVRGHLQTIRAQFSAGNYAAPTAIHGGRMPGLAALEAASPGQVEVSYLEIPGGAELTYRSADPVLVAALHAWFDAQISDHGRHAQHGAPSAGAAPAHHPH